MIKQPMFASMIHGEILNLDHDKLAENCYEILDGESKTELEQTDLHLLKEEVTKIVNKAFLDYGYKKEYSLSLETAWVNINQTTDVTAAHLHKQAFLSAVYYPKIDETCDRLEFMNPATQMQYVINEDKVGTWNEFNSTRFELSATTGMVVVFPSWLYHYTTRHTKQESDRISVAFNYVVS
jgi:uncharacterized protein (TIGR02466 family)